MKKLVFIFCILIFYKTYSQEYIATKNDISLGIQINENYTNIEGATFNPGILIQYNKHEISAYWRIFQRNKNEDILNIDSPIKSRIGFGFEYKYEVFDLNAKLNFNLLATLNLSNYKGNYETTYNQGVPETALFSSSLNYRVLSIGYGFKLRIIKGFFITQSFGFGLEIYKTNYKLELTNRDYTIFDKSNKYFDNKGIAIDSKIGLEYIF